MASPPTPNYWASSANLTEPLLVDVPSDGVIAGDGEGDPVNCGDPELDELAAEMDGASTECEAIVKQCASRKSCNISKSGAGIL